jgi:hypothetical protein
MSHEARIYTGAVVGCFLSSLAMVGLYTVLATINGASVAFPQVIGVAFFGAVFAALLLRFGYDFVCDALAFVYEPKARVRSKEPFETVR